MFMIDQNDKVQHFSDDNQSDDEGVCDCSCNIDNVNIDDVNIIIDDSCDSSSSYYDYFSYDGVVDF